MGLSILTCLSITLGMILRPKTVRADVSDLAFAELTGAAVVLNVTIGQNVSKILDGGYVYYMEIVGGPGGSAADVVNGAGGGTAAGWFDARRTGDVTISYWVGQAGGKVMGSAIQYKDTPTYTFQGGAGGSGYVAGGNTFTMNGVSQGGGQWRYQILAYSGGGGGSSAIVCDGVVLLQAKGGNGGEYGCPPCLGGGANSVAGVESMPGKAATTGTAAANTLGSVKITRYNGKPNAALTAGFSPNAVTGNGAGVTVN